MLHFISANKEKIMLIEKYLTPHQISCKIESFPFVEIQSENIEDITKDKAAKAFNALQVPLLVADHGWSIHGLHGFPGPYMKYVNDWFTPQNYLDLLQNTQDKRITMTEVVCYIDKHQMKFFTLNHQGKLIHESRGNGSTSIAKISIFQGNKTIAESIDKNEVPVDSSPLWDEFAAWYKMNITS